MTTRYNDHDEIVQWLRDHIEQVVQHYFPDAKRKGGDLRWDDDRCSVKVTGAKRGVFRPFAETDHGLDPIGLVQYAIGRLHDPDGRKKAFDEAREVFGIGNAPGQRHEMTEEERERLRQERERKAAERAEEERLEQEEKRAWAQERWKEADPPGAGHPYLNGTRGLYVEPWPHCVRAHGACPTKPDGPTAPCILVALQGPWRTSDGTFAPNAFMGVQRIYLSDDRTRKRDWKSNKLNYGPSTGAAMHLTPLDQVGEDLGVCEGLENGLSLMMMVGEHLPIWAATGTSNLVNMAIPDTVKRVTIFGDWDHEKTRQDGSTWCPGQDAAERLRDKLLAEGRQVRILYPNVLEPGEDWNDWIRRDAAELASGETTEAEVEQADAEFWEKVEATAFEQPAEPKAEAENLHSAGDEPPPHPGDDMPPDPFRGYEADPYAPTSRKPGGYGHDYDLGEAINGRNADENHPLFRYWSDWVLVTQQNLWQNVRTGERLRPDAFKRKFAHIRVHTGAGDNMSNNMDKLLSESPMTVKVSDFTMWPGKKQIVTDKVKQRRLECVNLWTPYELESRDGSDVLWQEWLEQVFPDDPAVRDQFEKYLAFLVQNPGYKVFWTPLIIGGQGIGKSTFRRVMAEILGVENVRNIDAGKLSERFNMYMAESQLIVMEDVDRVGRQEANKLKGYITDPVVDVEGKMVDSVQMPNRVNFLLFSNEEDPLHLDTDDRRYMVYQSPAKQNSSLASRFYEWLMGERVEIDEHGTLDFERTGARIIKRRLETMDLADFNPVSNAPTTQSKRELQQASLPPMAHAIMYLIEKDDDSVRGDVVEPARVVDALLQARIPRVTPEGVGKAMSKLGWTQLQQRNKRNSWVDSEERRVTLWARRNAHRWLAATPQERFDHMQYFRLNPAEARAQAKWHDDDHEKPWGDTTSSG